MGKFNQVKKAVNWVDATDHDDVSLKEIMENPTSKYFTKRKALGKVIKKDKDGIIILMDIDDDDKCQITAIPYKWTLK